MIERLDPMTVTATEMHVTCQDFCGLPISRTGDAGKAQHDENCGADADYLAKLDAELGVKGVQAAAKAAVSDDADSELNAALPADDAPAAKFRCSCGDSFETWEEIGPHQTETGHVGMYVEPNDALDDDALRERENSDTVDGQQATIKHGRGPKGPKIEKVDYSHLWSDPNVDADMVYDLQEKIDDGTLMIGGIAAGKACIGKATFKDPTDGSNVEVACPHKCFARTVRANECSLEHTHTETLEQVCLIHAITAWGAEIPPAGHGPLFPPDSK